MLERLLSLKESAEIFIIESVRGFVEWRASALDTIVAKSSATRSASYMHRADGNNSLPRREDDQGCVSRCCTSRWARVHQSVLVTKVL